MVRADLTEAFKLYFVCWWLVAPLAILTWIAVLPLKILSRLLWGRQVEPADSQKIELKVIEAKSGKPKDEILFVHGYPDTGELWNEQVAALSEDYRCLVVTLPYFSGKHKATSSWGATFPDISKGLAKIVEQHSNKKRVTILIHDWGSLYGFNF